MAYTVPRTWKKTDKITADKLNVDLRDNEIALKAQIDAVGAATGDMTKAVYDPDGDGIITTSLGSTPSTQAFGDAATGGSAITASKNDHKHAMPAAPISGGSGAPYTVGVAPNNIVQLSAASKLPAIDISQSLIGSTLLTTYISNAIAAALGSRHVTRTVGYFWGADTHTLINSVEYSKYSHIIYCQLQCTSTTNPTLIYGVGNGTGLNAVRVLAQAAGCKMMICLIGGDWPESPDRLSAIIANSGYRASLVSNLVSFVAANGLDGVDIDLEGSSINATNYGLFLAQLKAALPAGKIISVCGTAEWNNPTNQWFTISAINSYVDFINLMMYSVHPYPEWSLLADVQTYTQEWLTAGFIPGKLNLGITTQDIDSTGAGTDWYNVVNVINPANSADSVTHAAPWTVGSFTVNGTGELWWGGYDLNQSKVLWAVSKNLGGFMVYPINDDACGNAKSVISAITTAL